MANWDGSCFGGDKQNCNYFPSSCGVSNVQSFAGESVDWTCYPVSVTLPQIPLDGLQQLNTSACTDHPFQPVFNFQVSASNVDQNFQGTDTSGGYYGEKLNTNFNPNELHLEVAATSSLTPTAGEFIPRPGPVQVDSNLWRSAEEADTNCRKTADESRPLTANSYSSSERGNHVFRRHGGNDSKYFHSNRNPSSGPVYDAFYSNRRGNARAVLPSTALNSKLCMEKAKNQDRQRLLAEAAAFLTPSGNPGVAPLSDGNSNLNANMKQQNMNVSCQPKGKGEFSRAFMHLNKPNGDASNVRFKNCFPHQQENFSQPKRRNDGCHNQHNQSGFHERNVIVSDSGNGSTPNHQFRVADSSNGCNYRGLGASQHTSPKKEADQYRG